LVRDDSRFSDGNLAKLGFDGLCSSAAELSTFDFRKIYHGTWVSNEEREDIVSHRNAEIVVPNELDLSQLKLIYCRSAAEKETLLYLLPANIRDRWAPKIAIETTATLYYRQWAFVESATLSNDSIVLNFSPDAEQAGPFDLTLVRNSSDRQTLSIKDFYANKRTEIKFKSNVWTYDIEVYLDEHLAFAESYDGSDEIPF
jgi:hypothetical protein